MTSPAKLGLVGLIWIGAAGAQAMDRHVPGEYPTIQAAIDACVNGDTVIVDSGHYSGPGNRNLDFGGKDIIVRSGDGRAAVTGGRVRLSGIGGTTLKRGVPVWTNGVLRKGAQVLAWPVLHWVRRPMARGRI